MPSGADVAIYALPTATRVGTLTGHSHSVTGVVAGHDARHVLTCSLDGSVKRWDLIAGTEVATFSAGAPITHMQPGGDGAVILATCASASLYEGILGQEVQVVVSGRVPRLPAFNLQRLALEPGAEPSTLHTGSGVCTASAALPSRQVCAFAFRKQVLLWDAQQGTLAALTHSKPLTALSLCPTRGDVVAGDIEGQIWTWPGVAVPGEALHVAVKPTGSHWHATAALSVHCTEDGGYTLSGGAEGVIVIEQATTGSRSFVPRLGAAVCQVTCATTAPSSADEAPAGGAAQLYYIAALADNTVVVMEASSHKVTGTLRHMPTGQQHALAWRAPEPAAAVGLGGLTDDKADAVAAAPLAHHPLTGGFMVPAASGSGHMQVYAAQAGSPSAGTFRHSFRVTARNVISANEHTAPCTTLVTHSVAAPDGSGLMTAECPTRAGRRVGPHTLRFFGYVPGSGEEGSAPSRYALETYVDMPITDTGLAHVAWRPSAEHPMVATAAPRRTFRLWDRVPAKAATGSHLGDAGRVGGTKRPRSGAPATGTKCIWRCRSVGFFRDAPIGAMAFSGDGSLLAVSSGRLVPLWCPLTNALKGLLTHATPGAAQGSDGEATPVHALAWMGQSPRLLTASAGHTTLWDVVTCQALWTYAARTVAVAPVSLLPSQGGGDGVVALVRTRRSQLQAAQAALHTPDLPSHEALLPRALHSKRGGGTGGAPELDVPSTVQHLVVWTGTSAVPAVLVALPSSVPPVTHILPLKGTLGVVMLQCTGGSVWEAHLDQSTAPPAQHDAEAVAARVLPAAAAASAKTDAEVVVTPPAASAALPGAGQELGALHTLPALAQLVPFLLKATLAPARVSPEGAKRPAFEGAVEGSVEVGPATTSQQASLAKTLRRLGKTAAAQPTPLAIFTDHA